MRRPTHSHALRSAWVLALFVAGYLLGQLHLASERHVVCADHGEVTHESDRGHAAAASCAPAPAPFAASEDGEEAGEAELVPGRVAEAEHHHCPLASFHREDLAPFESLRSPPHAASQAVGVPVCVAVVRHEAKRFRLAPKQSPPA